ncbi:zinc finger BED domain-containing protein 1-like [Rhizophagus irregularis DAOM 181602=DAOM 197198]|nr:zinc finger BED domain-containing protein 1-like [Rhizophagus irregularis DAOM 181602=DAOM 197198]
MNIKNSQDRKFEILIKDNRSISICNNEGFVEFIHELDPNYQIPSDKTIQQLIAELYNQIKIVLTKKFSKNIISYSITTDLWTARSRNGYIGITCSFIDNNFNICEAILAVQYVLYPYTGDNICKVLRDIGPHIISNWNLNDKVFTIMTDNSFNIVKAEKLINELTRFPCTAYTLQFIVDKGLIPAEVLIDIIVTGENQEVELQSVSSNSLLARIFQDNVTHVKVANYLALPKIHHDDCPLTWWKTNKTRFLVLSKLARKYLAIPATSTLSEKLFSEAGNVMTIKRTQLAPNMLENLVFCKKNELAFGWRDFSFKY